MADDRTALRVLGIAGSLRAGSFNRALLRAAQELAPEVLVTKAHEKFDSEGRLTDEATRGHVRKQLEALRDWTLRLRGAPG